MLGTLDRIKNEVYVKIQELFAEAVLNEMAGDTVAYMKAIHKIAAVAEALGIDTVITEVSISLKDGTVFNKTENTE